MITNGRAVVQRLRHGAGSRGVTLVELVITLGMTAVVMGGAFAFVNTSGRSVRVTNDFIQTQAQVRAALDQLVDEMRWAEAVTSATGTSVTLQIPDSTPFSGAGPYLVTFAYDPDADTVTRQADPDAAGPLDAPAPDALAFAVVRSDSSDGLALEYFDAAGNSLGSSPAAPAAIVRIRITVTTTRDLVSRTFTTDAAIRAR